LGRARLLSLSYADLQKAHDQWMANWNDLVDFEVYPVITSKEAAEKIGPGL